MELWLPIIGYEGYYEISNLGRVRSLDRFVRHWRGGESFIKGKVLKQHPHPKTKYLYLILIKKNVYFRKAVHRLVGEHFLPIPEAEQIQINHRDSNRQNNVASNLEWVTRLQNMQHALANGRCHAITNLNMRRKLTPKSISVIRESRASGALVKILAAQFNVHEDTIRAIVKGNYRSSLMI